MKSGLSIGSQSFLAMLVGLLLGVLLRLSILAVDQTQIPTQVLTPTPPPPHQTLEGGWKVVVSVSHTTAPEIVSVQRLEQVRLLPSTSATNRAQLLNAQGQVIFEQGFETVFYYGEPPTYHEVVEQIIRLPDLEGAAKIRILTPGGEVEYDLVEQ